MPESGANLFDIKKPIMKENEQLCDGCWAVDLKSSATGWLYFTFKLLTPVWLCPKCAKDMANDMRKKQRLGL